MFSFSLIVNKMLDSASKHMWKNYWGSNADADGHDVYPDTEDTNCFKSHANSWCPDLFEKNFYLSSSLKFHLKFKIFITNIS